MSKILRLLNNNFLIGISNLSLQVTSFVFSLLNRHEILKNLRQLPIYRVHICVVVYTKYIQGKYILANDEIVMPISQDFSQDQISGTI